MCSSSHHQFIRDHYSPRFPELEQLVADPWPYMHAVLSLGNASDLTKVPLQGVLGPAIIMTVYMTASATRGRMLTDQEWNVVKKGCDAASELKEARDKVRTSHSLHHRHHVRIIPTNLLSFLWP